MYVAGFKGHAIELGLLVLGDRRLNIHKRGAVGGEARIPGPPASGDARRIATLRRLQPDIALPHVRERPPAASDCASTAPGAGRRGRYALAGPGDGATTGDRAPRTPAGQGRSVLSCSCMPPTGAVEQQDADTPACRGWRGTAPHRAECTRLCATGKTLAPAAQNERIHTLARTRLLSHCAKMLRVRPQGLHRQHTCRVAFRKGEHRPEKDDRQSSKPLHSRATSSTWPSAW